MPGSSIGQSWTGALPRAWLKEPPFLGWLRSEMQRFFSELSCSLVKAPTNFGASTAPMGKGPDRKPSFAKPAKESRQRAWSSASLKWCLPCSRISSSSFTRYGAPSIRYRLAICSWLRQYSENGLVVRPSLSRTRSSKPLGSHLLGSGGSGSAHPAGKPALKVLQLNTGWVASF